MSAFVPFGGALYRVGTNTCVDVPVFVSRPWGAAKTVALEIEAGGQRATTTAMRRSGGQYRVFITTSLRDACGVSEGDEMRLGVRRITELSEPDVPRDLGEALSRSSRHRAHWEALTLRQRRDFVRYLGEAKTRMTRSKRLAAGLERIREKTTRKK